MSHHQCATPNIMVNPHTCYDSVIIATTYNYKCTQYYRDATPTNGDGDWQCSTHSGMRWSHVLANSASIDWHMLATHHIHNYHARMPTSPLQSPPVNSTGPQVHTSIMYQLTRSSTQHTGTQAGDW
jgi:hypothetical protein